MSQFDLYCSFYLDIQFNIEHFLSKTQQMPGIIIELKVLRENINEFNLEEKLEQCANDAIHQIEAKQYTTTMKQEGISSFFIIGISFYKKHIKLVSKNA
ncbi:hypothetical protein [Floccifex sp.]|uniref:hypothetical protein n=1 Tax=Floccifex sp. TaxID=2815810 RepID=UPI002A75DC00|nr:hypothetical protein [Floccifex sp.]